MNANERPLQNENRRHSFMFLSTAAYAPVVQNVDNAIHWIAQLVSPILIRWMGFIWWIDSGTQPFEQSSPGDASQSLRE